MPTWADINLTDALTGFWWVMVALLGGIGARAGLKRTAIAAPLPPGSVEVAGALIDTKRVDGLIAALDMNTVNLSAKGKSLDANTAAIDALRRAVEEHARETRDLREETKDLRDELLRGSRAR